MSYVVLVGSSHRGTCADPSHQSPITVSGKVESGGNLQAKINNKEIALDGYLIKSSCGHYGTISASGSKVTVNNKAVAVVGDSFSGVFSGSLQQGDEKVNYKG